MAVRAARGVNRRLLTAVVTAVWALIDHRFSHRAGQTKRTVLAALGFAVLGAAPALAQNAGTASVAPDGRSITYTAPSQPGTAAFEYTVSDGHGGTATGTIRVTITGGAQLPVAGNSNATVTAGSSGNSLPLALSGGAATSVNVVSPPASAGTASASGIGILYNQTAVCAASDTVRYTAANAAGPSGVGLISITITGAPTPTAGPVSTNVAYNAATPITLAPSAAYSSLTLASDGSKGHVTISGATATYTPNPSAVGIDHFSYQATCGTASSAPGIVTVNIVPGPPVVADVSTTVAYGSIDNVIPLSITGVADSVHIVVRDVEYGHTSVSGTTIRYTPNLNALGDGFWYTATGPGGTSNTAFVGIGVLPPPVPTAGQPPPLSVAYNGSGTVTLLPGGVWDSVAISRYPNHGALLRDGPLHDGLNVAYSNIGGGGSTNGSGSDSFEYTVTGRGGTSAPTTVNITVAAASPPVASPSSMTVNYNVYSTADLLFTGPTTSLAIVQNPMRGTVAINGWQATYTPTSGLYGPDGFSFKAIGPGGTSAPATVSVTVNPPPLQPPTAGPATYYVEQDSQGNPMALNLGGGSATSVSVVQGPNHGFIVADGVTIYYTPYTSFHGVDSFNYKATNAVGTSAAAMVTVNVLDPNL